MDEARARIGRIVVGVDGSESSKNALRWAAKLAQATGDTIEAVTAWHYPQAYGWPTVMEDWRPDVDADKVLQETLDEVFGPQRPPGLSAVVTEGNARDVLLAAGRGAEMLVVGSRGHGGFTGLLLGSVSAACAEHARCPVVVVHEDEHRDEPGGVPAG
jgi:nucleotide-binding universal stress UspA family protein